MIDDTEVSVGGDRLAELARRFYCLACAPGVMGGWNPDDLDEWARGPGRSTGERNAARFVLSVCSSRREWRCGRFDVVEALRTWDDQCKQAFVDWVQEAAERMSDC